MLLALACHLGIAIAGQLFMGNIYAITAAEHGGSIGPNFFTDALHGLKAFGTMSVLSLAGIWLIKLNFLIFFYRIGHQLTTFRVVWWVIFVFSVGCGATCFGLLQYSCMFGDVDTIFVQCATVSYIRQTYIRVVGTAVFDILSDVASKSSLGLRRPFVFCPAPSRMQELIVMCYIVLFFPIYVLWKVKITLRKKILLATVFGLVGFTIAVTIVRGSIFGGVYKSYSNVEGGDEINISWITFWFYVEFTVCELELYTPNTHHVNFAYNSS